MARMTFDRTYTTPAGESFRQNVAVSTDGFLQKDPTIAAAKGTGTLTTRTDNDTGIIALPSGHGIVSTDIVDVYWLENGVYSSRRNMVATVSGDNVTVDGGAGANLPAVNNATMMVMKPVLEDATLTGNNVTAFVVSSTAPGWIKFQTSGGTVVASYEITEVGGGGRSWNNVDGGTNPLAGQTISKIAFSHGQAAATRMVASVLYD